MFVGRAIRRRRASALLAKAERREAGAKALIQRVSATRTQAKILRLILLEALPRSRLAEALGACEATAKAHGTVILAKCGARSFDELLRRFDEECAGDS